MTRSRDPYAVVCGAAGCSAFLGYLIPNMPVHRINASWNTMSRDHGSDTIDLPTEGSETDKGAHCINMAPGWKRTKYDWVMLSNHANMRRVKGERTTWNSRPPMGEMSLRSTSDDRVGYHLAPLPVSIVCPICSYPTLNIVDLKTLMWKGGAHPLKEDEDPLGDLD